MIPLPVVILGAVAAVMVIAGVCGLSSQGRSGEHGGGLEPYDTPRICQGQVGCESSGGHCDNADPYNRGVTVAERGTVAYMAARESQLKEAADMTFYGMQVNGLMTNEPEYVTESLGGGYADR